MTFYFDAQTYVLRGAEGGHQRIWLPSNETHTAADVPAAAFAFNPPAGAAVAKGVPAADFANGFRVSQRELASACHLTLDTLDAAAGADKTPLAACQQGDPTMTAGNLVDAILSPYQAKLNAGVGVGNIKAVDASQNLANLRTKLSQWATMPFGK
jgi:hypothetical protein